MKSVKWICAVLIFAMMVAHLTLCFAETAGKTPSGNQTKAYALMNDLGIFEGVGKKESGEIMSGDDFIKIMSNIIGYDASERFKNIVGSNRVTCAETMRVFISLLGYEVFAQKEGGFPVGYLTQALQLNLFKDLALEAGQPVTYSDFAQILKNSFEVEVMKLAKVGEYKDYESSKDHTFLSEIMSMRKIEGQITGNSVTGLTKLNGVGRNRIEIEGISFKIKDSQAYINQMIGYYVEAYYKIDDKDSDIYKDKVADPKELVYVQKSDKYESITIQAEDIYSYDNYTLHYTMSDNKDSKSIRIKKDAFVICNGTALTQYGPETFDFYQGNVTFLSGSGGGYDTVIINDYMDFVVSGINADDHILYNKISDSDQNTEDVSMTLDIDNPDYSIYIKDPEGKVLTFKDIRVGDVLSIAKSERYAEVFLSRKQIKDFLVTEKYQDDGKEIIISDKEKIQISEYFGSSTNYIETYIGDSIILSLNFFGKASFITKSIRTDWFEGYLVKAVEGKGLSKNLKLKIFRSDGIMTVLMSDRNITIWNEEGSKIKYDADEAYNILNSKKGVIKYKLNSEGNISTIEYPLRIYQSDKPESLHIGKQISGIDYTYKDSSRTFGGQWFLTSNTVIYGIPVDDNMDRDEEFEIKPMSFFSNDKTYDFEATYFTDEDDILLSSVVLKGQNKKMSIKEHSIVVLSVTSRIDNDGKIFKRVVGIKDGTKVVLDSEVEDGGLSSFEKATTFTTNQIYRVKAGDFIRCYVKPTTGYVTSVQILFRGDEVNPAFPQGQKGNLVGSSGIFDSKAAVAGNPYGADTNTTTKDYELKVDARKYAPLPFRILYGWVYKKNSNFITVTTSDLTAVSFAKYTATSNYIVESYNVSNFGKYTAVQYNNTKNVNARLGTINDIYDYESSGDSCSRVVAIIYYGVPTQLVVINGECR